MVPSRFIAALYSLALVWLGGDCDAFMPPSAGLGLQLARSNTVASSRCRSARMVIDSEVKVRYCS
jgi:hypothetical protein